MSQPADLEGSPSQLPVRLGDHGPVVAEIRQRLAQVGLLGGAGVENPDDATYDEQTAGAVRRFQQARGLTVDGVVGTGTYRALDEARWSLGDRVLANRLDDPMVGDDVSALQDRLLELGFDIGRVDGLYGPRTAAAVCELQRNVGLPADGACGPATFQALRRIAPIVRGGSPTALREYEAVVQAGPRLPGKTVVVDPGHGGPDQGVTQGLLTESELVFDIARRIEGRFAATGVRVYLTRGPGASPTERERAAFANQIGADLVVSLHVDGHSNPAAGGVAAYYYGSGSRAGIRSPLGERFAGLVQREIVARTTLPDCRVHPKSWDLLRYTRMPAVRVELGYLTNPGDAACLADPDCRDRIAEAVVVAVQRVYLPPNLDAPTGVMRLGQLLR